MTPRDPETGRFVSLRQIVTRRLEIEAAAKKAGLNPIGWAGSRIIVRVPAWRAQS